MSIGRNRTGQGRLWMVCFVLGLVAGCGGKTNDESGKSDQKAGQAGTSGEPSGGRYDTAGGSGESGSPTEGGSGVGGRQGPGGSGTGGSGIGGVVGLGGAMTGNTGPGGAADGGAAVAGAEPVMGGSAGSAGTGEGGVAEGGVSGAGVAGTAAGGVPIESLECYDLQTWERSAISAHRSCRQDSDCVVATTITEANPDIPSCASDDDCPAVVTGISRYSCGDGAMIARATPEFVSEMQTILAAARELEGCVVYPENCPPNDPVVPICDLSGRCTGISYTDAQSRYCETAELLPCADLPEGYYFFDGVTCQTEQDGNDCAPSEQGFVSEEQCQAACEPVPAPMTDNAFSFEAVVDSVEGTIMPEDAERLRELVPGAHLQGAYDFDRHAVDPYGDENMANYSFTFEGLSLGVLVAGLHVLDSYNSISEMPTQITVENDYTPVTSGIVEDRYEVMVAGVVSAPPEWFWSGAFFLTLISTSDLTAIQDTALPSNPPELERFDTREVRLSLYNSLTTTSITVNATVTALLVYE